MEADRIEATPGPVMSNDVPVIRVAVPVPVDGGLDYAWRGERPPPIGCRVVVTVGRKKHIGVVLEHPAEGAVAAEKLKPALEALDDEPIVDAQLLATLAWCASYYHHPIGEVVTAALPVLLRRGRAA